MAPSPFSYLALVLISNCLGSLPVLAETPSRPLPRPFKAIYAFGDSYTDTGNTNSSTGPTSFTYVSNAPYGTTFFHKPTNRYSDGRIVIDFIAQSLSLPFLPPYLNPKADTSYGVNFAVAGATAIRHGFFAKNNLTFAATPQSLGTELVWFQKFLLSKGCENATVTPRECAAVFNDALVWVGGIGTNDYAYSYPSFVSRTTVQKLAIKSVSGFLQAILEKGAKYVVVQGLPPTGCLTFTLVLALEDDRDAMGCVGSENKISYTHNALLQTTVDGLRKQFPEATIVYADFWSAYSNVRKNAKTYGIKEPFKACCGTGDGKYHFQLFSSCGAPGSTSCPDPAQYIMWDGAHLTEAMYRLVAESFVNGPFCRPSFNYLISKKQQSG